MTRDELQHETQIAHRYFRSFADDYQNAVEGRASRSFLHGVVNRLFRRNTLQERTKDVHNILDRYGISGKTVLDLGCGPGQISILAAQLGARVTGLDLVEEMVQIANDRAQAADVADAVNFRVANLIDEPFDRVDITLMVGVVEYYRDLQALLTKASQATRELFLVADTRGPFWRRQLRFLLARLQRFRLYYHPPEELATIFSEHGFRERERLTRHSYTVMVFERITDDSADE